MPPLPRRVALIAALALVAGGVTACGVRFSEPPPPVPTADAAEVGRAEAVESAQAIATLARQVAVGGQEGGLLVVVDQVASGSETQAQTLGGTWTPPPRPSPGVTEPPSPGPSPDVSAAGLAGALVDGAASARAASVTAGPDIGRLLVSIAVWRELAARAVADAAGVSDADSDADGAGLSLGARGVDDAALAVSTIGPSADLIRGLDGTAFAYETLAARTSDDAQRTAWVSRSAVLRRAGETVAVASGVAGTGADPRQGVYDVAALLDLDPATAVASMEASLADLWLDADVPAGVRPVAADAALECYLTALAAGAQLGALDAPRVVLPGFVTP